MQRPMLEALLGSVNYQQWLNTWPDKCFDVHGALDRLPAPFSDEALTSISSLAAKYTGGLFEMDPASSGARMYPVTDRSVNDVVDAGKTAYLSDISSILSDATVLVQQLEQELGINRGSVRLGAFISAAGSGAPTHYDAQDVISIQLVGHKKFYVAPLEQIKYPYGRQFGEGVSVFDSLYPQVSQGFPDCKSQTFTQVDMHPGSVLFMPRGTWHYTEAEGDSMAISIVLNPTTEVDHLLSLLKHTLLQDAAWRAPRYALEDGQLIDPKLYSKISNTIFKLSKDQQNPNSPLRSLQKESRFICNPYVDLSVTPKGSVSELKYQGCDKNKRQGVIQVTLPQSLVEIVEWCAAYPGPFTLKACLKAFPNTPESEIARLVAQLVNTGFLTKLWFSPL